ncbi:hypothetical protein F3Y22_tig00116984pilonHSYRG00162 [Hibiscus syriacus]|uniref:Uncharacterized protein n=1 Tax=Hibiscus syriacus TaxID=106335 RepID=A0A6A2XMM7_HIBSY|nr:desiccation-related protein PCC13-62-like [Hibiscus syriacus]KAE8657667.1 hypothetical protein F3Y22_tig00116984pilonHSYRG00162 [Hibiscus syriacus]
MELGSLPRVVVRRTDWPISGKITMTGLKPMKSYIENYDVSGRFTSRDLRGFGRRLLVGQTTATTCCMAAGQSDDDSFVDDFRDQLCSASSTSVPAIGGFHLARIELFVQLLIVKTEFFLRSIGLQINNISPGLVQGPDPIGATNATVDILTRRIIEQFALSNVRLIRAIVNRTLLNAPLQRPLITVTPARIFLLAVRFILSVITQYEDTMTPLTVGTNEPQLLDGIKRTNVAEYGAINALLFQSVNTTVPPTTLTVGNLTNITAEGVNVLGRCGAKNEGMIVPLQLGAENRTTVNVVPGDVNSLAVARTTREALT